MIQTPVRYDPQVTENRPVNLKDDFNTSKNQMKVSVQILSKENVFAFLYFFYKMKGGVILILTCESLKT